MGVATPIIKLLDFVSIETTRQLQKSVQWRWCALEGKSRFSANDNWCPVRDVILEQLELQSWISICVRVKPFKDWIVSVIDV